MTTPKIPIIDFSAYIDDDIDLVHEKKSLVINEVSQACSEYGFFQVMNHGVPQDLLNNSLYMYKTFFDYPKEEKLKYSAVSSLYPTGYGTIDI